MFQIGIGIGHFSLVYLDKFQIGKHVVEVWEERVQTGIGNETNAENLQIGIGIGKYFEKKQISVGDHHDPFDIDLLILPDSTIYVDFEWLRAGWKAHPLNHHTDIVASRWYVTSSAIHSRGTILAGQEKTKMTEQEPDQKTDKTHNWKNNADRKRVKENKSNRREEK